jgi:hypothetical protein
MSLTDARELALINNEYGAVAAGTVATRHSGLFTTAPADSGSGGTEVTGGNYSRVAVTNNATNFPSANPKLNANPITYPQASADWGTIKATGWWDAASAGNLLSWAWLCDNIIRIAVGLNAGDIIHAPGHAFANDTKVIVWAPQGVTLPGGLVAGQEYYVINAVAGQNLQVSLTQGGAAVAITSDGGMTIARSRFTPVMNGDTPSFAAGGFSHEID